VCLQSSRLPPVPLTSITSSSGTSPCRLRNLGPVDDTAAFKFDSLPGITFVATRYTAEKQMPDATYPEGWIEITPHRVGSEEGLGSSGLHGPTAPPSVDKPFVPGGKVPFIFRSLPGYTFYASRAEREVIFDDPTRGKVRVQEGWIRQTFYLEGDDEEHELGGFAGPRADS
jgi:hypothetical protein